MIASAVSIVTASATGSTACRWLEPHLNETPIAAFDWNPRPCNGLVVTFVNRSTDPDEDQGGGIKSSYWDFDDGPDSKSHKESDEWRYSKAGTYRVYLEVVDNDGFKDALSQTVEVCDAR